MTDAMPAQLVDWIEAETGGRVRAAKRGGDGASRQAWAVELTSGAGEQSLFCLRDQTSGSGGSSRDAGVLRALAGTGIPVPRVHAANAALGSLLLDRVRGRSDFPAVDREEDREPTARDLMRLTAALHALDPQRLAIEHLGAPTSARGHATRQLDSLDALLRSLGGDALAVQTFAASWLRRSPPVASRTSLVHSDMGPGNFLAEGGRVTALLDWEVAHWGDPMEDLAAIAVRDMATPIGPLGQRYAEYAAADGAPIDLAGIAWYRVFILARNSSLIALGLRRDLAPRDREPLERFQLLLLRALALCLCDGVGIDRPGPDAVVSLDATDPQALAHRYAVELQSRARAEADLLGSLADRFPQRLAAS